MLHALLKPQLVWSNTIVSDAPNSSIIYNHKFIIVKLLKYWPQDQSSWQWRTVITFLQSSLLPQKFYSTDPWKQIFKWESKVNLFILFCKLDCLNTLKKIVYNNEMAHLTKKLHKFTPKTLFYWSLVHQNQKSSQQLEVADVGLMGRYEVS